ncbi:YcgL domain-containing protein [Candidatus Vondammii sp. HM_W22]|uniref:YcgL domain-containing protein n=1 Tax=Candidatus Vondammii sp. HM_W22 TaxID=2687299 RepID=UPI001F13CB83|nr:YcgL domain-containing protein [Candidatus Vondammii sp. HM_W22]
MTQLAAKSVNCWIYRSSKKREMYLYLADEDAFDQLPAELMKRFGKPSLVMELMLHPGRPLAREDVARVMDSLEREGYHLQLPPKLDVELYRGD